MNNELKNTVEALLMVSDVPLSVAKIQGVFDQRMAPSADDVKAAIVALDEDYADRSIEIRKIGSGYRIQTREQYAWWVRKLLAGRPPRLSRAQLETLAIIAYQQPVTRGDIEEIRGVAVSPEIMQRLMEREWVKQVGVRDTPGRPELFGTTPEFLSYFNLTSLKNLPPLKEQRELSDIAKDADISLPDEVLSAMEPYDEVQKDVFAVSVDSDTDESDEQEEDGEEFHLAVEELDENANLTGPDGKH